MAWLVEANGPVRDDEEEKRKRQQAIAAKPKQAASGINPWKQPSAMVRSAIERLRQEQPPPSEQSPSPLAKLFAMQQKHGAQYVQDRTEAATDIWRRYYKPYDGPGMVSSMVNSPFSIRELEQAARMGERVLKNLHKQDQNYIPAATYGSKDLNLLQAGFGMQFGVGAELPEIVSENGTTSWRETDPTKITKADWEELVVTLYGHTGIGEPVKVGDIELSRRMGLDQSDPLYLSTDDYMDILTGEKEWPTYSFAEVADKCGIPQWEDVPEGMINEAQVYVSNKRGQQGSVVSATTNIALLVMPVTRILRWGSQAGKSLTRALSVGKTALTGSEEALLAVGASSAALRAAESGNKAINILNAAIRGVAASVPSSAAVYKNFAAGTGAAESAGFGPDVQREAEADQSLKEYLTGPVLTDAQRMAHTFMAGISQLELDEDRSNAIIELKKFLQSSDEFKPAFGQDLPLDGSTTGLLYALTKYSSWEMNNTAKLEYEMMAEGFLTADEITGVTMEEDETGGLTFVTWDEEAGEWTENSKVAEAFDGYMREQAASLAMAEDNPTLWYGMQAFGIPQTGAGWKAWGNRLLGEGIPSVFVNGIMEIATTMGSVYNAVPGFIEYKIKMDRDPVLDGLKSQLLELGRNADLSNVPFDLPVDLEPGNRTPAKLMMLHEEGYLQDEELKSLAEQVKQRELEILHEPNYSWVGLFSRGLTNDYEGTSKWLQEHEQAVRMGNIAVDVGMQAAFLHAARNRGSSTARTAEALTKARGFQTRMKSIYTNLMKDNVGGVERLVDGADGRAVAQTLQNQRNQINTFTAKSPLVQARVKAVLEAAMRGDKKAMEVALGEYATKSPKAFAPYTEAQIAVREQIRALREEGKGVEADKLLKENKEFLRRSRSSQATNWIDSLISKAKSRVDEATGEVKPGDALKNERKAAWTEAELADIITRKLVSEQRKNGSVFGRRELTLEEVTQTITDAWSGANGRYFDILPKYAWSGNRKTSRGRVAVERMVGGIRWTPLRITLSTALGWTRGGPLTTFSYQLPDFAHKVGDAINTVTNDMAEVIRWQNKAVMTDFTRPRAAQRFESALASYKKQYLAPEGYSGRRIDFEGPVQENYSGLDMSTGSVIQPTTFWKAIHERVTKHHREVRNAELRGRYTEAYEGQLVGEGNKPVQAEGATIQHEVVMNPLQLKHEIYLGGSRMLFDKLRTDTGKAAVYAGMTKAEAVYANTIKASRIFRNYTVRPLGKVLTVVNIPLRVTAVALGAPILAAKHFLNDMLIRNAADRGFGTWTPWKVYEGFRDSLAGIKSNAVLSDVMFQRQAAIFTDQHYTTEGGFSIRRQLHKAFNGRGHLVNFDGVYNNFRRIAQNPAYEAYLRGGERGLQTWLDGADGVSFMEAGGHTRRARAVLKDVGIEVNNVPAELVMDMATTLYKADALALFDHYGALPVLSESLMSMAKGEVAVTPTNVRKALEDAYKAGENPTVDVPVEVHSGNKVVGALLDASYTVVKTAMIPNRVARRICFEKIFGEVLKDQLKQGLPYDDAAVVAGNAARVGTNKTHFDLSQAWRVESKARWFAWFATKHRLWNTWLAKAAVKYPGYAMGLEEFKSWMDERNEDKTDMPWEKFNVISDVAGGRFNFNFAPYMWMTKYPLESTMGLGMELGAVALANEVMGTEFKGTEQIFPWSITRADKTVRSVLRAIQLVGKDRSLEGSMNIIESYPEADRERYRKRVVLYYANARRAGDTRSMEEILPEAVESVVLGDLWSDALSSFKSASTHFYSAEDTQMMEESRGFSEIAESGGDTAKYLQDHPLFALTIGATERRPDEQIMLVEGISVYRNIVSRHAMQVANMHDNGTFSLHPDEVDKAYTDMQVEIEQLKDLNEPFRDWMDYTGEDRLLASETARYVLPMVDADAWEKIFDPPSENERDQKKFELKDQDSEYTKWAQILNMVPDTESSTLLGRMLKNWYVDTPLEVFSGYLPGDLTGAEIGNYRTLYDSGAKGPEKASAMLEMTISEKQRKLWMRGLNRGAADKNNLFYALLSPPERQYLGLPLKWEETQEGAIDNAEDMYFLWLDYAVAREQLKDWAYDTEGMSTNKKAYQDKLANLETTWAQRFNEAGSKASYEWWFSHLSTSERLRELGWDEGGGGIADGWATVLDIVDRYYMTLREKGLTKGSSDAKKYARAALTDIAGLAKTNTEWLKEWRRMGFSPVMFGIPWSFRIAGESGPDLILFTEGDKTEEEDLDELDLEW